MAITAPRFLLGKPFDPPLSDAEKLQGRLNIGAAAQADLAPALAALKRPLSMDKAAEFAFGLSGSTIFTGADRASQGLAIAMLAGVETVFILQTVAGSSNQTDERKRIVAVPMPALGSGPVTPTIWSQSLALGHQSLAAYWNGPQLMLVSEFVHQSGHVGTDTGKGFSTIAWKGPATSQADVTNYQLFGFAGSGHRFQNFHGATVTVSPDGKWLVLITQDVQSADDGEVDDINDTTNWMFVYDFQQVLAAPDPLAVNPILLSQVMPPDRGERLQYKQGIATDGESVWLTRGYSSPRLRHVLLRYDMFGNLRDTLDIDGARAAYTVEQLSGSGGTVPASFEPEGLALRADGTLVMLEMDDWRAAGTVVSFEGRTVMSTAYSASNASPRHELYWTPAVLTPSGPWVPDMVSMPGSYVRKAKTLWHLRHDRAGAFPLSAGKTLRPSGASLHVRSNRIDLTWRAGDAFRAGGYSEALETFYDAWGYTDNRVFRLFDMREGADNTKSITFGANFSGGKELLEIRPRGSIANGAGVNIYGNADVDAPGQLWFSTGGLWHGKMSATEMRWDFRHEVLLPALSTGNNPTTPQTAYVAGWKEGSSQDLGSGEGAAFAFSRQLVADPAPIEFARFKSVKRNSTDTDGTSDLAVELSPTGMDNDRRDVLGFDAVTGKIRVPFGFAGPIRDCLYSLYSLPARVTHSGSGETVVLSGTFPAHIIDGGYADFDFCLAFVKPVANTTKWVRLKLGGFILHRQIGTVLNNQSAYRMSIRLWHRASGIHEFLPMGAQNSFGATGATAFTAPNTAPDNAPIDLTIDQTWQLTLEMGDPAELAAVQAMTINTLFKS